MTKLRMTVVALLALGAAQTATVAIARTADAGGEATRVVVSYGDLNLATRQGADALRARVDLAARRVKGEVDPRDLRAVADLRRARATALGMANAIIAARAGTSYAAYHGSLSTLEL